MALGASLEDAGLQVEGPFTSRAAALEWLDANTPGIAIIDYRLKDGCCLEIARALCSRGVPFIVYSGLPRLADLDPAFRNAPWLEKPIGRHDLLNAVAQLVPTSDVVADGPVVTAPVASHAAAKTPDGAEWNSRESAQAFRNRGGAKFDEQY